MSTPEIDALEFIRGQAWREIVVVTIDPIFVSRAISTLALNT